MGAAKAIARPWTAKEVQRACDLRRSGQTHTQIASSLGRTLGAVRSQLQKHGCVRYRCRLSPEILQQLRDSAAAGCSLTDLMWRFKLNPATAVRWSRLAGVQCKKRYARTKSREHRAALAQSRKDRERRAAAAEGWPEAETPKEAQILQSLLDRGAMSRTELATLLGSCSRDPVKRLLRFGRIEVVSRGPGQKYRIAPWLAARRAEP